MKKITLIIVAAACVACGMTRESRENETCGEATATSAVCDITPHTRGDQEANAPWITHLETLKPALAKQNEIDVYFKRIRIIHLEGEDSCYDGKEGVIEHIDGIGQLHANIELLEGIRNTLFGYAEKIANIQKEVRELDKLVKNPTRA